MATGYDIRVSERARSMRVSVFPDGAVRVTVPRRFSVTALERFIAKYAEWIEKQVAKSAGRTVIRAKRALIPEYKREARRVVEERCAYFAKFYGVRYGKISVRAQKSRWGSCSRAGNLSFNYKITLLSPEIADYIVVHELCHLLKFDHSRAFWSEVEKAVPDHKRLRAELQALAFRFE